MKSGNQYQQKEIENAMRKKEYRDIRTLYLVKVSPMPRKINGHVLH